MKTLLFFLLLPLFCLPVAAQLDLPFVNEHANEIVEEEGILTIRNDEEAEWKITRRITILNENSSANSLRIYYDPENKILDYDAGIYDLSGKSIRKVRKSEVKDYAAVDGFSVYNDSRVQVLELHYSQYPYVVEFEYRQRLRGIRRAALPTWFFQNNSSSAVSYSRFVLNVTDENDCRYRSYNAELEPAIEQAGDYTSYRWEMKNIPAFDRESYSPGYHRLLPMLRLSPQSVKVDNYEGNLGSWNGYGRFISLLYEGRDVLPPEQQFTVRKLTEGVESDTAKINSLYRHLQNNFRYVSVQLGIGGWQPFDAAFVAEQGYGDCKALSNYMKAMLQVVGIESYPVIIRADRTAPYAIEDDFVDPDFNHVVLYIPEHDYWLECTSKTSPPNYLGYSCHDRRVLLVTPEGGQIAHTPKLGSTENRQIERARILIDAEGGAAIEYEGTFQGIDHEYWRSVNNHLAAREIENEIQEFSGLPALNFTSSSLSASPDTPTASLNFAARADRYASRVGKRLFVPLNAICPRESAPDAQDDRRFPIRMGYGYTEETRIQLQIPEGFHVESLPESLTTLDMDFGTYELTIEEGEGEIVLERRLIMTGEELAAERYAEFRQFFVDVARYDQAKMVLVAD